MSHSSKFTPINILVAIHEEAMSVSSKMKEMDSRFIEIIQRVDKHKVYLAYKFPSLFKYLTLGHGFSESQAYDFIVVARACHRFDKLDKAVKEGRISVSKARRITPVLSQDNQEEWLKKAHINSHRDLEKLAAEKNPQAVKLDGYGYISKNQIEVKIILTEEEFGRLQRAQDLLCQKEKKPVSLKNTLTAITGQFLQIQDPTIKPMGAFSKGLSKKPHVHNEQESYTEKKQHKHIQNEMKAHATLEQETLYEKEAKNQQDNDDSQNIRAPGTCQVPKRKPVPSKIFHQVNLRDQGLCQEILPDGSKCNETKWIDLHHIKHVQDGGLNTLDNLITLCKGHHQMAHQAV